MNRTLAEQLASYTQMTEGQQASLITKDEEMVTAKKTKKKVDVETKDKILALWKEGFNGLEIDKKLGLGKNTASYHIRKMKNRKGGTTTATKFIKQTGRGGKRSPVTQEQIATVWSLHGQGYNNVQISQKVGLSPSYVGKIIKNNVTVSKSYTADKTPPTVTNEEVVTRVAKATSLHTELEREKLKNEILMEMLERATRKA